MIQLIFALVSGVVFGLGLLVSGLANPVKVQAFLDVAGAWDPSLGLVMAGAIFVGLLPFSAAKRHPTTWVSHQAIQLPAATRLDAPLIIGALLFGVGWGLLGICPGPALVLAGSGSSTAILFLAAMLLGMRGYQMVKPRALT